MSIDAYPERLDLNVYQGDTWVFTFTTEWTAAKLDVAAFTIRDAPNGTLVMTINSTDESSQFDIATDNEVEVTVTDAQSTLIDGGTYWFDLELEDTSVERKTAVFGQLIVQGDITYDNAGGAPLATTTITNTLRAWTLAEIWGISTAAYDTDQVLTSATVLWPDGTSGTLTRTAKDATHLTISAFTVTYGALTVTQSTIVRNASGNVTSRPLPTVA